MSGPRTKGSRRRDDRVWQAGFLVGSALAELLSINGLEAPSGAAATHLQLTTGDVERFRSIAGRMFGEAFPDVAAA